MPKQIQFRRGSANEHATFTGAIGEITVDTTNKTLRVHDGETAGGTALAKQSALDSADYVTETQLPTAENNYTWFRKYKSGWIEQGGQTTTSQSGTLVTFPVEMADTNYQIQITCKSSPSNYSTGIVNNSATTTSIKISTYTETRLCCWELKGYAA